MIYAIANIKMYERAFGLHGCMYNTAGSYAFQTYEDAERRIQEHDAVGIQRVFGMDATWDQTVPDSMGDWCSYLTVRAKLIPLGEK